VGKVSSDSGVKQHLTGLLGSNVTVTVEINTEIPPGAADNVVHNVIENCRTFRLKKTDSEEN
jgi:hypothetical protein